MSMKFDFLNLASSTSPYSGRLKEAAARVIDSGRFINGPECAAFERELAQYLGISYCVGVSNGLDAIRLIFRAYIEMGKLTPGDEVIVQANTYIASILPLVELGLTPVLAPVSPLTLNIDFERIEEFITPRTRAVMPVHLYGTPAWDAKICKNLHNRGILIIEDNAQAIGSLADSEGLNGSRATGTLGDAAAISFYPTKNLGALGDAGAVVTNDSKLADMVRTLANYGSDRRYHNILAGYNNRLDEIQAAFLRIKLEDIDAENARRDQAAEAYMQAIRNPLVTLPQRIAGTRQTWHQFIIRSPRRDDMKRHLEKNDVMTDVHYPVPPHMQPCFKGRFNHQSLKEAEDMADTLLSLPIGNITADDARQIAEIINGFE